MTDVLGALRRSRTPAPEPKPSADTPLRAFHDGTRDYQEITLADWPEYRSRGYRQLAPHERREDLPAPVERGRAIFPPLELMSVAGQTGIWLAKEIAARDHLNTYANRLAERIDRPPVPRPGLGGKRQPSPVRAADLAQAAITAEATALLWEEVDSLREQVNALQAAQGEGR